MTRHAPFTAETARAAAAKSAAVRRSNKLERQAAVSFGLPLRQPAEAAAAAARVHAWRTLAAVLEATGRQPPWHEGPSAVALLEGLARLANDLDRRAVGAGAAARRSEPAPSDPMAAVRAALAGPATPAPAGGSSVPPEAGGEDEAAPAPAP